MQDVCTLPFVCAATRLPIARWCGYIKAVMSHPELRLDEKILWMWLAIHSASQSHHSCSFTYEQLSYALERPCRTIHCALFRLRLMGLLNGDIPVWYGEPTPDMIKHERILRPFFVSEDDLIKQSVIKDMLEESKKKGTPIFDGVP
jgi:hypothetical protein